MSNAGNHGTDDDLRGFTRRVVVVVLIAGFAFLLWQLRHTIVLAFAAVVVAVILTAAAACVERVVPVSRRWSVVIASVLIVAIVALAVLFASPQIQAQSTDLLERLPEAANTFETRTGIPLPDTPEQLAASQGGALSRIWGEVTSLLQTVASTITGLVLVLVAGVFLAINPNLYRDGFVLLFPPPQHGRACAALDRTGHALRLWLAGKLLAMAIIGGLVGLGAWLIGLPSPLALALIAFLTEFVPLIGPFVGAVPGLLLALGQDANTLLWTAGLYVVVQQVESNLVTPLVQRRMVTVPPALFMLAVVAMGALFGVIGILLSGPLTVAAYVLVRALYVEDALGEHSVREDGP